MAPDPLYVAAVAENVRSSLRTTDDPNEVRRYLYELRDTLYEAEFDGEPYVEMLDALESHLGRLEQEALGSIGDTWRERIIDEVHRIERFCQRQQDNDDSKSTDDDDVTRLGNNITINIGNTVSDEGSSTGTTGGSSNPALDTWRDDSQLDTYNPPTWAETTAWDLKLPFGTTESVLRNGSDWPTYRRDLRRQGADSDIGTFGAPTLDWKTYLAGSPLGEPAVLGERLVVPTKKEGLLFLSRSNGDQLAQFDPGTACYTSPVVYDGTVCCGFDDGFYAIDRWGDRVWGHSTNNWVRTVPLAFDDVILFGDSDGTFYALDADTGRLQGSFNRGDTSFEISPAIYQGTVVAGTAFTALGIDYETGTVDWTTDIKVDTNSHCSKAPTVIDGTVYYPGEDAVYALNPNTGVVQWRADISNYGRIVSAVAATDASLYVCTHDMDIGGYLHTIRTSGTVERTDKLKGGRPTSPVATDWGVIVGSMKGPLERYEGGESPFPEWTLGPSDDWTRAAPIVNDGTLYASFSRSLYAFS